MKEAESIRDTVIGKGQVKMRAFSNVHCRHCDIVHYVMTGGCVLKSTHSTILFISIAESLSKMGLPSYFLYILLCIYVYYYLYIYIFTYSMYIRPRVLKLVVIFAFRCHTTWRDNVCNKTNLFSCLP